MTISDLISTQKAYFQKGSTRPLEKRLERLITLRNLISDNEEALCTAISEDFGKPYFEAYTGEIYTVLNEIDFHIKHLPKWIKPKSVGGALATFPSKNMVYHHPLGTTLIIGAWNYPIYLTMQPLTGAISAGNTVVLKPSELAPHISSTLKRLFDDYFPNQLISVVEGGVDETQELLTQPFNKIFFTGSVRVGKIVMKAAAEQLIPVTLELGGKSPAIIHSDANMEVSAKRIWWGKTMNAGQICVSPDFTLVHESKKDEFIDQSKKALSSFFPEGYLPGENFTQIINDFHFTRLVDLFNPDDVLLGGSTNPDTLFIEPTLIQADWDEPIMQQEIFGPLLPILTYQSTEELVERLTSMPSPLALYLFSDDTSLQDLILEKVPFGGGCFNDVVSHLANPNLPYGGVGPSGMGSYHGRYSFDTFTRKQALLKKSFWPDAEFRYPPYEEYKLKWFKKLFS